jgi:transcriptional regulator with XRE-family HTH domain
MPELSEHRDDGMQRAQLDDDMQPVRATLKLRNNRLLTLREQRGMTQKMLADACGVTTHVITSIEHFGSRKREYKTEWRYARLLPHIETVARYFDVEPEYLLPRYLYEMFANKLTTIEKAVTMDDLERMTAHQEQYLLEQLPPAPDVAVFEREIAEAVYYVLATMTPREERVIRAVCGIGEDPRTMRHVALDLGYSPERLRQIKFRAYKRFLLQACSFSRPFLGIDTDGDIVSDASSAIPHDTSIDIIGCKRFVTELLSVALHVETYSEGRHFHKHFLVIHWQWIRDTEGRLGLKALCDFVGVPYTRVMRMWLDSLQAAQKDARALVREGAVKLLAAAHPYHAVRLQGKGAARATHTR